MPTPIDVRALVERSIAYSQPIVDLNTGDIVGAETLVRFVDPDGSVRAPAGIIERIEDDPDAIESLMWRLFRAIEDNAGPLLDRHRGFYISLNVPPVILGSLRLKRI